MKSGTAIYTVCTGHYKHGLFALIKSLRKYKYEGPIIIATDKIIDELSHLDNIEQVNLHSDHIYGNLKGKIVLERPYEKFIYLDPDVIQMHPEFINIIIKTIVDHNKFIVCSEGIVPKNEIRRLNWNRENKIGSLPQSDYYYSGGFFAGNFQKHRWIIEEWDNRINEHIKPGDYFNGNPVFPLADQDMLNAVVQNIPEDDYIAIGIPDWLSIAAPVNAFHPFGAFVDPLYVHATGKLKPWLVKKLPMRYPNIYDQLFYEYYIDDSLFKSPDLNFSKTHKMWFRRSKMLPFYNKFRRILNR